jgi:anaerobic magnesium-protoporphyrin IX monomethyl ester cyclase
MTGGTMTDDKIIHDNLGARSVPRVREANFPTADDAVRQGLQSVNRSPDAVDVLLVNPPAPDGGIWIRSQHRVGRRSRENMVWPQVSLAQLAALLIPVYKVQIIDAIAEHLTWPKFSQLLERYNPKYYLTQVTAPTLENDMYGVFLARSRGAKTIAFGTHVTPMPVETMRAYPVLDFALYGEPDLTLRDLIDHLEDKIEQRSPEITRIYQKQAGYQPSFGEDQQVNLKGIQGVVWRKGEEIIVNAPRPFVKDLDDLPIPLHHLLPLKTYRMPMMHGPFTFIVTSRGCPAGCTYCIKHVSYQYSVRVRSPEKIMEELWVLKKLGINNIHMYADLFTINREQVVNLCKLMIDQKINIRWTCNSRVDFVDEEELRLMRQAGCWFISWGIESANDGILKHAHKGVTADRAMQALKWSHEAGMMNWGYFIIGLPGETEDTIRQTIQFAKKLPLDIALFHIAAPYPGTPFFFEVVEKKWFRPDTRWEQVDMDRETVLDYPDMPAEKLMYWQKRAFREWAMRSGPAITYLKMLVSDPSTFTNALSVGIQTLTWQLLGNE